MQHGYKITLFFLPADGETIWIVTLSLISFTNQKAGCSQKTPASTKWKIRCGKPTLDECQYE